MCFQLRFPAGKDQPLSFFLLILFTTTDSTKISHWILCKLVEKVYKKTFFPLHLLISLAKGKKKCEATPSSLILTEMILWWCHPQHFVLHSENMISYPKAGEITEFSQWHNILQPACEFTTETQQKIILEILTKRSIVQVLKIMMIKHLKESQCCASHDQN